MRRTRFVSYFLLIFAVWIAIFMVLSVMTPNTSVIDDYTDNGPAAEDEVRRSIVRLRDRINRTSHRADALQSALSDLIRLRDDLPAEGVAGGIRSVMRSLQHTTTAAKAYTAEEPIAVLVMACNRPEALTNHLHQLLKYRPLAHKFPVIVSQDCDNPNVTTALQQFGANITHLRHIASPINVPQEHKKYAVYYKLSSHFRWALNKTFEVFSKVIVTEDDLDIAEDFFEYFGATSVLLDQDSSLWCVSAWNDNGKLNSIDQNRPELLHRTDFFPGLGWMITDRLWRDELAAKWPNAFWDDWMRDNAQRQNRSCIYPEVSRTAMSPQGQSGASLGLFYTSHLRYILLNKRPVEFTKMDLSHLLKENYDRKFLADVYSAVSITALPTDGAQLNTSIRLTYTTAAEFHSYAKQLNLMNDFRSGVPRTAYLGVVEASYNGVRVYLAPPYQSFHGYNQTWN